MKIDDEQIINYLEGRLSDQEAETFSAAMSDDQELREAYQAHVLIKESLQYAKDEELKNAFASWAEVEEKKLDSPEGQTPIFSIRNRLAVAASLVIMCAFGYIFYQNHTKPERLFAEFYSEPIPHIKRDSDVKQADLRYQTALQYYVDKNYDQAIRAFSEWAPTDENFGEAQLILIDACIQNKDWDAALDHIKDLLQRDGIASNVRQQLEWTHVLILIRQKEYESASEKLHKILDEQNHLYYTRARSLRDKME
jgi:tetratricopeptide (TPR) repeat protein